MNKTIWKFPLEVHSFQVIEMPEGAEILTVQVQNNAPCLWAVVDPAAKKEPRSFETCGTGWQTNYIPSTRLYIGTYQLDLGELVFHLFEIY